jgi:hypothetical protein
MAVHELGRMNAIRISQTAIELREYHQGLWLNAFGLIYRHLPQSPSVASVGKDLGAVRTAAARGSPLRGPPDMPMRCAGANGGSAKSSPSNG